jgi:ABC-2 type transport system ATP-binding protein
MGNSTHLGADHAIDISGLRVVRGRKEVLSDLNLQVPRGQVVGLLGPSGSGKTTLMRAIVGAQIVAGGSVKVLGEDAGSAALRRRIGYVTQAPSVYSDLTARENLAYFGAPVGAGKSEVTHTLHTIGLNPDADRPASTLSGGQLSRVSLGAALVGSPELLVLDEPTVGLDPLLRRDLWDLMRSLADQGTTLLVSSHVMDEAVRCDRLLFMREGEIIADGPLSEILASTGTADAESAFLAIVDKRAA